MKKCACVLCTDSKERYASRKCLGVLDGVPIIAKDNPDLKRYVSYLIYSIGLMCYFSGGFSIAGVKRARKYI